MKTIGTIIALIALSAAGWWVYTNSSAPAPEALVVETPATPADPRSVVAPGSYAVDASSSVITWEAQKPLIPGYVHRGTIGLSGGAINVSEAAAAGMFDLDMNTVKVTSLGGGKEGKESALEGHLKKSDFFDVTKYPAGKFEITSVEPVDPSTFQYTIKGTLTLKDKTNPVEFPATIYLEDGILHAKASLSIDRTQWGVSFGSKTLSDKLGDNMIDDEVKLILDILARQQ